VFKSGASVLGYSSQAVNYPAINAISTSPTQKWRTTGKTSEYISLDLGLSFLFPNFNGWKKAKPIIIPGTYVPSGGLTNVPVMVRFSNDSDIGAICRSDGYDIRFCDDSRTELSQYRLSFSVSSGQASGEFWVLLPSISQSGKTIYVVFGNPSASDISNSAVNPDILTDGDFEQWNSPTALTNWNEYKTGSSTINQESTQKTRGNYSVRLDIDANNSVAAINQDIKNKYIYGKKYILSFKVKSSTASKKIDTYWWAIVGGNNYFYDFQNNVWQSTIILNIWIITTDFQTYSVKSLSDPPSGLSTLYIILESNQAASSSLYFDDAHFFAGDTSAHCDFISASWYSQFSPTIGSAFSLGDSISAIGIYDSNLTDNAQITLSLSDNSDFSGASQISLTGSQVKDKMYSLGVNYMNRYAKIAIADTGNSASYLEIGTIWLAGKDLILQPTEFSEKVNIKDIYDESYNIVGFFLSKPSLRNWSLTARITSSDDVTMLQNIITENTTSVPFYIESDDDARIVGHPITTFTRFSETPEIDYIYVNYWTASASLIETR
jgi:hypothetical protein